MRIVNIMLGRGAGGIEQAVADYCHALRLQSVECLAVTSLGAQADAPLAQLGIALKHLPNWGAWDISAAWRLRRMLRSFRPDAIITHGNRAFSLAHAASGGIPIIAVAHNYQTRRFIHAHGVFAPTRHLAEHLHRQGIAASRIFHIPNMVALPALFPRPAFRSPPVIGAMGRMVAKKGFDIYLHALAELKARSIAFRALLGGSGEEEQRLIALANRLGLADSLLTFTGWVKDRTDFFDAIDMFCLPSLHEPFGIVLLEAFAHAVPVIATDAEGPQEIAIRDETALLVPKGNAAALADTLAQLLRDQPYAAALGLAGRNAAEQHYTHALIGTKMLVALRECLR